MRRMLSAMAIAAVTLVWVAPMARAQEDEPAPKAKPYVAPPAWKSVEIGNYYLKRKKYRAALSRFQEAVTTDPTSPPGYLGLGKVYEKIGLKQKAIAAYQRYLDMLPSARDAEQAKEVHAAIERLSHETAGGKGERERGVASKQ